MKDTMINSFKQINLHIHTDSESMIKKLNTIREYPIAKYKMTIHPEQDVLSALHEILETYLSRPTIEWVQSHQDDQDNDNKTNGLNLNAQINIKANGLATEGLKSLYQKEKVAMDPKTCVQVHIHEKTITRDLK